MNVYRFHKHILPQHLRPIMNTFGFGQVVLSAILIAFFQQSTGRVHAYLKERDMVFDWNLVST
jgi:prolyl-tRNA synthetase